VSPAASGTTGATGNFGGGGLSEQAGGEGGE
jgi:hypothetical protein